MEGNQTKRTGGAIYWIAMWLFVILTMSEMYLPHGADRTLYVVGILLVVFPVAIVSPGVYVLRKYGNSNHPVHRNVYALVRHPQYLGQMIMSAGFMAVFQHVVTTIAGFFSILFLYFQIEKEEENCLEIFGEAYRRYSLA